MSGVGEALAKVLALVAKSDAAQEALPGILTTPASVRAYDVAADEAVNFLRAHGPTIAALEARALGAERDAERYRAIFTLTDPESGMVKFDLIRYALPTGLEQIAMNKAQADEMLDAAIDAAALAGRGVGG